MTKSNSLTKAIIDFIHLKQGAAFRVNTTGIYDEELQQWKKTGMEPGFSDIQACCQGRALYVEVKIGKDKQSKEQKAFQIKVEKAGGLYYIAKEILFFVSWFNVKFPSK